MSAVPASAPPAPAGSGALPGCPKLSGPLRAARSQTAAQPERDAAASSRPPTVETAAAKAKLMWNLLWNYSWHCDVTTIMQVDPPSPQQQLSNLNRFAVHREMAKARAARPSLVAAEPVAPTCSGDPGRPRKIPAATDNRHSDSRLQVQCEIHATFNP